MLETNTNEVIGLTTSLIEHPFEQQSFGVYMKTIRNLLPWIAVYAGILTILLVSSPAWVAESSEDQALAVVATQAGQSGAILAEGDLNPIDENAAEAPGSGSAAPVKRPDTNELYNKLPSEIIGLDVVDADGKVIGTVDDLVIDKALANVSAVVEIDQFLGLVGGKKVVIPLNALQPHGDELRIALNRSELKTSPEYLPEYFVPIPERDQRPIIDFLSSDNRNGGYPT
ncbi:MAG: PRC-barrel domain-containing protein [Methylococcaceae bacterium]|nr:PRC-barrel domain-containing protein [Methylococcaceae bacterium]MCI0734472.1 PRC-barrel domain-containing protein [Methylococcaceae bacterium]